MVRKPKAAPTPKSALSGSWYCLIDAVRGFALVNMIFFHFFYDVYVIFLGDSDWYLRPAVKIWQRMICTSFLLIAGISWHFSRNNLKRGLLLNLYGILISAVTLLFIPSQAVRFGILNCIGCSVLLMIPLHGLFRLCARRFTLLKRPGFLRQALCLCAFFLSLLLFFFTENASDGYLSLGAFRLSLPSRLYRFRPMTVLGFPFPGFFSSDYFPMIPWFFLFLAGYFLWDFISCHEKLLALCRARIPLLSQLGRNTIWIYLLHQPVLYAIVWLLFGL